MRASTLRILSVFLWCVLASTAYAAPSGSADAETTPQGEQAAVATPPVSERAIPDNIRVGIAIAPPFIIDQGDGTYDGLAIRIWENIAKDNGWRFTYIPYDFTDLLDAATDGTVDVGIGAVATTAARQKVMDFAHPTTSSGLGVAVRNQTRSGWLAVMGALLSPAFLKVLGTLSLLLFIVGFISWLFERRHNPDEYGGPAHQGIFTGFWWAMVTMTTVGYGDVSPRSVGGRITGLIWMLAALVITSFFTASITSALTVGQLSQQVTGAEDLAHMELASVPGTSSEEWLEDQHYRFTAEDSLDDALQALASGKVDAVVYDKPLMKWLTNNHYKGKVHVLPLTLERQDYAFALPQHSPLRQPINTSLLKQIGDPDWITHMKQYLQN